MKNFSAGPQLEFDYPEPEAKESFSSEPTQHDPSAGASAPLKIPNFSAYGGMYAVTARIAGRVNAAITPESERQSLLKERQALLDKKLHGEITRDELNRLQYVRWSLDRIEDARHGHALDELESYVNKYEQFLSDVRNLHEQLKVRIPGTR
jgi:hypothetical protein